MNQLSSLFKGSDTWFGIFYPRHYILAAYHTLEAAKKAELKLHDAGWARDECASVPGSEVIELAEELRKKEGLWGLLMTELSRGIDTEATYADHDLKLAKRGAGFLAAYCPSDLKKNEAWKTIGPTFPIVARYYALDGIEHLAGET